MFKVSASKDAVQEQAGASYIAKSGIYDVEIKFASVDVSANDAESVNFNIEWEGNSQVIYGPYVQNTDGSTNEIGAKLINKLAIIVGMEDGDEFDIQEETHTVGKDSKAKDFAVITDFSEVPVKMRLQEEYSMYNGEIKKRMVIKSFFREDGASAEEIVEGSEIGNRLAMEEEKYAHHITYKDGLTEEDVEAWKAEKASGGSKASSTPRPKKTAAKKQGSLFGK